MDNKSLNKELHKFKIEFIEKHDLSCNKCIYWEKNRKGKCASKVYCIVRDDVLNCNFKEKKNDS